MTENLFDEIKNKSGFNNYHYRGVPVGKIYDVVEYNSKKLLAHINVDGTKVGVYTDPKAKECEVTEYD